MSASEETAEAKLACKIRAEQGLLSVFKLLTGKLEKLVESAMGQTDV